MTTDSHFIWNIQVHKVDKKKWKLHSAWEVFLWNFLYYVIFHNNISTIHLAITALANSSSVHLHQWNLYIEHISFIAVYQNICSYDTDLIMSLEMFYSFLFSTFCMLHLYYDSSMMVGELWFVALMSYKAAMLWHLLLKLDYTKPDITCSGAHSYDVNTMP